MANVGTFKIEGLQELHAILKQLPLEVQEKATKAGAYAMAKGVHARAVAGAPSRTGVLRKNLGIRRTRGTLPWRSEYDVVVRVKGKRRKDRQPGQSKYEDSPYYWHFVEFGTVNMVARPFLRPALEGHLEATAGEFRVKFKSSLDRIVDRMAKSRNARTVSGMR